MTQRRQVAVIGSGGCEQDSELATAAEAVGRGLAEAGVTVVCGGLGGVMEAVARGGSRAGGEVIGIIPGNDPDDANRHCTHVVATGIGHGRNLAVVASGEVVVAIGGEWGTLSEIGFARAVGRPVVALTSWEVTGIGPMQGGPGIATAADPASAVAAALEALSPPAASG
jgi:uncharacterized protein (TIGR00725 family)